MSTREQLIKARLGLLQLAEELDNVKLPCKRAGISRSHFYEIKEAFKKFGREGLAPQPKRRPRMPNQTRPRSSNRSSTCRPATPPTATSASAAS
ncbi:MAG TPA: hypothetical protein PLA43_19850 [Bryobacteraceae bacterium]|jgi:hypothetical protein|nr:hypothetical protein [Bryobacteraceae bacterium]HPU74213.1 hypothetical protein [Bryobacteraceae bacterium]